MFCGSSPGARPVYGEAAEELAGALVDRGLGLVFGGASVGLMGLLADAVLERGGEVTGVIPRALVDREIAHPRVADLRVVESMHERKALMAELADAFVALPGGLGTLEELFEIYTWAQLGLHRKPCALLNVAGYYDGVAALPRPRRAGALRPRRAPRAAHHRIGPAGAAPATGGLRSGGRAGQVDRLGQGFTRSLKRA